MRIVGSAERNRHERRPREGGDPGRGCGLSLTDERRKPNGQAQNRSGILQSQGPLDSRYDHAGMTGTKAHGAPGALELVRLFGATVANVVPAKAGTQDEDVAYHSPMNEG